MKNLIIKKWIEPYRLLETVKAHCILTDYTFDGSNKIAQRKKMSKDIQDDNSKFALYMKNVNKFYVFTPKNDYDLFSNLIEVFGFTAEDYEFSEDCEYALELIDMGKAEASFLNIN